MDFGLIRQVFSFFAPPDPPVSDMFGPDASMKKIEEHMKSMARWRRRVAYSLFIIAVGALIATFTPWGFVRADNLVDKIEESVKKSELAKSVEEIKVEQQTMKTELTVMKHKLDDMLPIMAEIYKASTASTICRLLAARMRQEADSEQTKYKAIAGDYYPESRCGSGS